MGSSAPPSNASHGQHGSAAAAAVAVRTVASDALHKVVDAARYVVTGHEAPSRRCRDPEDDAGAAYLELRANHRAWPPGSLDLDKVEAAYHRPEIVATVNDPSSASSGLKPPNPLLEGLPVPQHSQAQAQGGHQVASEPPDARELAAHVGDPDMSSLKLELGPSHEALHDVVFTHIDNRQAAEAASVEDQGAADNSHHAAPRPQSTQSLAAVSDAGLPHTGRLGDGHTNSKL